MKAFSLLLAAVGGAGVIYHGQVQSWLNSLRQNSATVHLAPEGTYYLRTAYHFTPPGMAAVDWAPGQELHSVAPPTARDELVVLTDGRHVVQVPLATVTRDMDDAASLRQMDDATRNAARELAEQTSARERAEQASARQANSNHLVSGQFHSTGLDAPVVRTNRSENIVSTAGAPVVYSTYVVTAPAQRTVQRSRPTAPVAGVAVPSRQIARPAAPVYGSQ